MHLENTYVRIRKWEEQPRQIQKHRKSIEFVVREALKEETEEPTYTPKERKKD